MIPKRGRPKLGEDSFSDRVYKAAVTIWRNGYKPFTRQNIVDFFEYTLKQDIDPDKVTSALNYLKSKGLLRCKSKSRWYLVTKKEYPDLSIQKYFYRYHPLPRCCDCVWLSHIKTGKSKKKSICTCPDSIHYNTVVDTHIVRTECITSKPYMFEGYLTEKEIFKRGLHVNPFYPKKYYKVVDGKVVWKGE